jgi:hypothetical protein
LKTSAAGNAGKRICTYIHTWRNFAIWETTTQTNQEELNFDACSKINCSDYDKKIRKHGSRLFGGNFGRFSPTFPVTQPRTLSDMTDVLCPSKNVTLKRVPAKEFRQVFFNGRKTVFCRQKLESSLPPQRASPSAELLDFYAFRGSLSFSFNHNFLS